MQIWGGAAAWAGVCAAIGAVVIGCGHSSSPSADIQHEGEDGGATDAASPAIGDDAGIIVHPTGDDSGTAVPPSADGGHVSAIDGGVPAGWLFTKGGKIYLSDGTASGAPWIGRGVNTDDIYFCGYNNTLYLTNPDATMETIVEQLITTWKATFFRVSLWMDSYPTVASWLTNPAQYKTPMTAAINKMGSYPGVYVLITLRSNSTMSGTEEGQGLPATTTDPTYVALVDSFQNDGYVAFGLSNEPGGEGTVSDSAISAAMAHAVGTIRAEEDRLGVPHHIVSVQGNDFTSDISFYAKTPLTYDNVVYEVHGYPPPSSGYTFPNIPVILGEYGPATGASTLADAGGFYEDLESKGIPSLAWDADPFSNCAPDLVNVDQNASGLQLTAWGTTVQQYLQAH